MIKQHSTDGLIRSGIVSGVNAKTDKVVVTSLVQSTENANSLDMVAIELDIDEVTTLIDELEAHRRTLIENQY